MASFQKGIVDERPRCLSGVVICIALEIMHLVLRSMPVIR